MSLSFAAMKHDFHALTYTFIVTAIHKYQHFHECTNHTLFETPSLPKKEYTSTFFECQNAHDNNKNQAKKLKVYENILIFTDPPPPPPESVWFVHP